MFILLAFLAQATAKDFVTLDFSRNSTNEVTDKLVDKVVDKLADRAIGAVPLHHAGLDETMLEKPGHVVASPRTSLRAHIPIGATHAHNAHGASVHRSALSRIYRPQLKREAILGQLASRNAQFNGRTAPGRHVQTSAYDLLHHEVGNLADIVTAYDAKAALSLLHDLPIDFLNWYDKEAIEFPLTTKSATAGVCYSIGDLCAQGIGGKNLSTVDVGRFVRSGAAGAIGYGPAAHFYLSWIDQHLSFGGAWWAVLPKFTLNVGPITVMNSVIYSLLVGAFAFRDPKETLRDVKAAFQPSYTQGLRFWPPIDFATFTVVPVELQVLWYGVAKIFWICILSRINNEGIRKEALAIVETAQPIQVSGRNR